MNTVNLFKANIIESINYDESLLNRRDFILTSYVFNYSDGSSVISTLVEDCLNELNYIIKNKIPIKPIDWNKVSKNYYFVRILCVCK